MERGRGEGRERWVNEKEVGQRNGRGREREEGKRCERGSRKEKERETGAKREL